MEEQLISFETARLAKEKRFTATKRYLFMSYLGTDQQWELIATNYLHEHEGYLAPTQSLLQRWLREEKNISVTIKHYISGTYSFDIKTHNGSTTGWTKLSGFMEKGFYKYEEALEEGLKRGLELIK